MNTSAETTVAAVQMNSGPDLQANLDTAGRLLAKAAADGAHLAVLPENFPLMGHRESDKLSIAEEYGKGPIQDFLAQAARQLKIWIVGGTIPLMVPARPDRVYASSLVYGASGVCVARYDKVHLFDVDVPGGERYRESATIAPGAVGTTLVESPFGQLGLSVCYDVRFPELYRALSARGAELLLVPSAFTDRTGRAHWEILLRTRAVENQCYVVAPNQCGIHPGGRRTYGHSAIVGPWGEILAQIGDGEGVVTATVSLDHLRRMRTDFPVLRHRRL